jgi:hypothetical protein
MKPLIHITTHLNSRISHSRIFPVGASITSSGKSLEMPRSRRAGVDPIDQGSAVVDPSAGLQAE